MILLVKSVEQISVERMNFVDVRERLNNLLQLFAEAVSGESDLSHVEGSDTGDLEARSDDGGRLSLGSVKNNIEKLVRVRNHRNVLPR